MYHTSAPIARVFFIETKVFTQRIQRLGLELELRALQVALEENPLAGPTEAGTGGLRKIRLPDAGRNKGKRSGARVHYLYLAAHHVIYLLFVYSKDEQDKLDARQKRQLWAIAHQIKAEWAQAAPSAGGARE